MGMEVVEKWWRNVFVWVWVFSRLLPKLGNMLTPILLLVGTSDGASDVITDGYTDGNNTS